MAKKPWEMYQKPVQGNNTGTFEQFVVPERQEYTDPQGNKQLGYSINDQTYVDRFGTERIPVGSTVTTDDGNTYKMMENGGQLWKSNKQVDANGNWIPQGNQYFQIAQDIWSKIQNREPFQFDLNGNALYQQYRDQYQHLGQRAMQDTMGQAAGLTGGYGSSYAQSVGQQTYDEHLQRLNDIVPDLYAQERAAYDQQTSDLYNQMSAARGFYNDAYNQYLNEQSRADTKEQQELARQDANLDRAINNYWNILKSGGMPSAADIAAAGMDPTTTQNLYDSYKQSENDAQRDAAYSQVVDMVNRGMTPNDELIARAGLTPAEVAQMQAQINRGLSAEDSSNARAEYQWYISMGLMPPQRVLAALGLSQADAQRTLNAAQMGFSSGSGGSGGRGRGSGGGGGGSTDSELESETPAQNLFTDPNSDVPSIDQWRAQNDTGALAQDVLSYGYKGPGQLSSYGQQVMDEWLTHNYGMSFTYYLQYKYSGVPDLVASTDLPILRSKG